MSWVLILLLPVTENKTENIHICFFVRLISEQFSEKQSILVLIPKLVYKVWKLECNITVMGNNWGGYEINSVFLL